MNDALSILREIAARPCFGRPTCGERMVRARAEGKFGVVCCTRCRARATLEDVAAVTVKIRDVGDTVVASIETDPVRLGAEDVTPAHRIGLRVAHYAMRLLASKGAAVHVGDDGAEMPLDILLDAIDGKTPGAG